MAQDLAVRRGPEGGVELAVLMVRPPGVLQTPESRVILFRWDGAPPVPSERDSVPTLP